MTETTAQPLTREDITAAVIAALRTNTVNVVNTKSERLRNIGESEQAARDRHPAGKGLTSPFTCDGANADAGKGADDLLVGLECSLGVGLLEGVREGFSPNRHSSRKLRGIEVDLKHLAVELDNVGGVVPVLNRNRRVHPDDVSSGVSVVLGSEESQMEALSVTKEAVSDRIYIGKGRVVTVVHGSVIGERSHDSSPAVDGCGDPTVGDGPVAGAASTTPAAEAAIASIIEAIRDARVDEVAALRLQRAAESNLAEMNDNLAYAKNQTRTAELALLDHINGGAA